MPTAGERLSSSSNRLPHLPILVGAGAAWVLGMVWHSQYVFRPQWTSALGLTDPQTLDLAAMWTPHLLTAAACVIFAYGVGSMVTWMGTRSLARGVQAALALWFVASAVLIAVMRSTVATDLVWMEASYTFPAAIVVGAIVGGAPRRMLIRD